MCNSYSVSNKRIFYIAEHWTDWSEIYRGYNSYCTFITEWFLSWISYFDLLETNGFATTHVVVSVRQTHLLTSTPPINLPKYVEDSYWREVNWPLGSLVYMPTIHAIFVLTVRRIRMFFRLKSIRIRGTVSREIACIVGKYTSDPSGQFSSLQYESSTYLGGW